MNRNQTNASVKSGCDGKGRGPRAGRDTETRISGGASWIRRFAILTLLVAIAGCQPGPADVGSTPPEAVMTTGAATTAKSDTSTVDPAPISGPRPPVGSSRQRYLSVSSRLIVNCMNDLGWEATYDPRHGALLAEVPPSQIMERDRTMSFCVAGSHNNHGIYAY